MTYLVQQRAGAVGGNGVVPFPWPLRVANALTAYMAYVAKMVWPSPLAVAYPYPHAIPAWSTVASLVALLGVSATVIAMRVRRPYLFTGWFWFVGMLIPVIGLIQVGDQSMADRYTYMPLVGLFVIVTWGAWDLCERWRWRDRVLPVAVLLVLLACVFVTRRQVAVWESSTSLWRHALDVTEGNYVAASGLGKALVEQGRYSEAVAPLEAAIRFEPGPGESVRHPRRGAGVPGQDR